MIKFLNIELQMQINLFMYFGKRITNNKKKLLYQNKYSNLKLQNIHSLKVY